MKKVFKYIFLCCILFSVSGVTLAQSNPDTLAKDNVQIPLPTIGVNFGITSLMGDVALENNGPSPFRQFGYQLTITQGATKFLNASFELYTGTVYGEEQRDSTNINFRTTLFSQHLNIEYNFYPLLKPNSNGFQMFRPYVGFGIGAVYFRSKGDLKDSANQDYYFWSDGSVRDQAEGTVDISETEQLERDFNYETDLRDANLDGLKKYSQVAFRMPLNAGLRVQLTKNFGINAAVSYALNFTDLIDNVNQNSVGNRAGNTGFDNNIFGSIGINVFLGRSKHSTKPKRFEEQLAESELLDEENSSDQTTVEETSSTSTSEDASEIVGKELAESTSKLATSAGDVNTQLEKTVVLASSIASRSKELNVKLESGKDLTKNEKAELKELANDQNQLRDQIKELYQTGTDITLIQASEQSDKPMSAAEKNLVALLDDLNSVVQSEKRSSENAITTNDGKTLANSINTETLSLLSGLQNVQNSMRQVEVEKRMEILLQEIQIVASSNKRGTKGKTYLKEEFEKLKNLNQSLVNPIDLSTLQSKINAATVVTSDDLRADLDEHVGSMETQIAENAKQAEANSERASVLANQLKADNKLSKKEKEELVAIGKKQNELKSDLDKLKNEGTALAADQNQLSDNKEEELSAAEAELQSVLERIASLTNASEEVKGNVKLDDAKKTANAIQLENTQLISGLDDAKSALSQVSLERRMEILLQEIRIVANRNDDKNTTTASKDVSGLEEELTSIRSQNALSNSPIDLSDVENALAALTDKVAIAETTAEANSEVKSDQEMANSTQVAANSETKAETDINDVGPGTGQSRTKEEIEDTPPKISGEFLWADVNKNGWISPDEVLYFIDLLFEGEAERTVEDIQNLIDYYFDQE